MSLVLRVYSSIITNFVRRTKTVEVVIQHGETAKSQEIVPARRHWGVLLSQWPRVPRPFVIGKHRAKTTVRDKSNGTKYDKLHLYSHSPEQVLDAIKNQLSRHEAQNAAVESYRQLRSCLDRKPEDPEVLVEYFKAFDQMFFLGALNGLCYIEVVAEQSLARGSIAYHTSKPIFDVGFKYPYEARIRVCDISRDVKYAEDPDARLDKYIEVITHECIHAVIYLYTCVYCADCRSCNKALIGSHGHLQVFQEIARFIEITSEKLLGRSITQARLNSLANDIARDKGRTLPEDSLIIGWDLDPDDVYGLAGAWADELESNEVP